MTSDKAIKYIGKTVRATYTNKRGFESSRVGVVTNVTLRKIIMLVFDDEDEDYELYVPIEKDTRLYPLNIKD